MLFAKGLGVALLAACGLLGGWQLAIFERRKCRQAEGFVTLVRNVRLQIDCFGTPVSGILGALDERIYAALGTPCVPKDLNELLKKTLLLVDTEYVELLRDFAASLGTGFREEELRYCDSFLARLVPLAQKTRADLEKRTRLALILPPALSAALILLLC